MCVCVYVCKEERVSCKIRMRSGLGEAYDVGRKRRIEEGVGDGAVIWPSLPDHNLGLPPITQKRMATKMARLAGREEGRGKRMGRGE